MCVRAKERVLVQINIPSEVLHVLMSLCATSSLSTRSTDPRETERGGVVQNYHREHIPTLCWYCSWSSHVQRASKRQIDVRSWDSKNTLNPIKHCYQQVASRRHSFTGVTSEVGFLKANKKELFMELNWILPEEHLWTKTLERNNCE